jgi:hypothetical protein
VGNKKLEIFDLTKDVHVSDIDPIKHYILFGAKERRNPSSYFETSFYLDEYPDVAQSSINPTFALYLVWCKRRKMA